MQKNCQKRSAKNVKFYLVALIRGEAGNAFLPFSPGTRVLGETKGGDWAGAGEQQVGWGRLWAGQEGSRAPGQGWEAQQHPNFILKLLSEPWLGQNESSMWMSLIRVGQGVRLQEQGGLAGGSPIPSSPALECSRSTARSTSHAGSLQPWLGRQGERNPSDANPHEMGLKWVFISVSDGCENKNGILLKRCFFSGFAARFLFASWPHLTESHHNRLGASLNNNTEVMRQIWGDMCQILDDKPIMSVVNPGAWF